MAEADATAEPIVQVEALKFRWRRGHGDVLDVPAFAVQRGERLFVKGASGSGKTTLLSLLGGVIVPQTGTVAVLGTPISSLRAAERDAFRAAHVGFVFQMFNLIPYLPLVENVTLPCRFSQHRRDKVLQRATSLDAEGRRLLVHLGLDVDALANRPVTELSVGQQQRVAVARALIGAPELVIADEPTSSLDADARQSFLALLFDEARAAGATVIFVSHDGALESFFDRGVALSDINRVSAAA